MIIPQNEFHRQMGSDNSFGVGLGLVYYASDAAREMEFADADEFLRAVEAAMQTYLSADVAIDEHFRQVFRSSFLGTAVDWKLSKEAYHLVCMSGSLLNPNVARIRITASNDLSVKPDNQFIEP